MEFLKKIFGSSETGPKWGGITSATAFTLIGAAFGGVGGAVAGLVGGTLLGPVFNDIFFDLGRRMGWIEPPPRSTKIEPKKSTEDLPAPVKQPDGSKTPTVVRAAILENMEPPPESALKDAFDAREAIRLMMVKREGNSAAYDEAVVKARKLEVQTDTFAATIEAYFAKVDEYNAAGGKRDELKKAIETSLKDMPNKLTADEIEAFVPKLNAPDKATRKKHQDLLDAAIPDEITLFEGIRPFPLAGYAQGKFIKATTGKKGVDYGTIDDWNKKSTYEKLNYLLNELDKERAHYEYKSPLNWDRIGNTELRDKTAKEMYDYAVTQIGEINSSTSLETEAKQLRKAELEALKRYAMILQARNKTQELVTSNVGTVLTAYTDFRNKTIEPDTKAAHYFASERLNVYNTSGIAVFAQGNLVADMSPDGKECHYLTYKDCSSETSTGLVTLIAQEDDTGVMRITHRIDGGITAGTKPDYSKGKLKEGVVIAKDVFTALKGKEAGKTLRTALTSVKANVSAAPAPAPDVTVNPMQDLTRQFMSENKGLVPQLLAADTFSAPSSSGQPTKISTKKKEKATPEVVA